MNRIPLRAYVLMGVLYILGFFVGGMVAKYNNDHAITYPTQAEIAAEFGRGNR